MISVVHFTRLHNSEAPLKANEHISRSDSASTVALGDLSEPTGTVSSVLPVLFGVVNIFSIPFWQLDRPPHCSAHTHRLL